MSAYEIFQFIPRPEAKAMQWNQLVPPVQYAVRDLLVSLAGAVRQSHGKDKNPEVANCFLVNGERGTGKTSVLLNVRKAVEDYESFFVDSIHGSVQVMSESDKKLLVKFVSIKEKQSFSEEGQQYAILSDSLLEGAFHVQSERNDTQEAEALECAKKISQHAIWLDILDLEPLQAETNLLTTVLTRIRKALSQVDGQDGGQEITSLFEASPDSARPLLDRLIGDATLMWEDIKEPDTRNIANRQVAAAGIYAGFKVLFKEAMDKLTEELGRPYGKGVRRSIILPIDNIDRSTEHLHSIVKLAQLISHPNLWMVMAGGREDISTFLERAYWKELIRNTDQVSAYGALGRNGSNGEDETLTMARRQAAATAQKIWPSSHRVAVSPMQPEQTLAFFSPNHQNLGTIEDLLYKVNIPTWLKKTEDNNLHLPLLGLFEHLGVPFDISDLKSKTVLIERFENLKSIGFSEETKEKCLDECINFFDKCSEGEQRNKFWLNEFKKLKSPREKANSEETSSKPKIQFADYVDVLIAAYRDKQDTDKFAALCIKLLNVILDTESEAIFRKRNQAGFKGVTLRHWVRSECDKCVDDTCKDELWPIRFLNKAILQDVFSGVFSRPFTWAALNGLRMPARNVIELWQIVNWAANDETYFNTSGHDKAAQIIRTMLRNAISESSLSSRVSRFLQETVIRNYVNGGTLLNFRKFKLEVECVAPNDTEIWLKNNISDKGRINDFIRSCIRVKRGNESFLRFKLKEVPNGKDDKGCEEELPEFVAAWLSMLYDVLVYAERLAVLGGASIPPPKMATRHTLVTDVGATGWKKGYTTIEKELQWPAPEWSTFRAHGLFWRRWTNFQRKVELDWDKYIQEKNNTLDFSQVISRYLVIGWIRCILDTYADMHWQHDSIDENPLKEQVNKILEKIPYLNCPKNETDIFTSGTAVLCQASVAYICLTECLKKPLNRRKRFDIQEMHDWLEKDLPMFFSHWYLPIDNNKSQSENVPRSRFELYTEILESPEKLKERFCPPKGKCTLNKNEIEILSKQGSGYTQMWKEKAHFIVAAMEDKVSQLFQVTAEMTDHDRKLREMEHQYFLQEINYLCSLHTYLNGHPPQRPANPSSKLGTAPAGDDVHSINT